MSVILTNEQFQELIQKTKKITKTELDNRKNVINMDDFIANFNFLDVNNLDNMTDYIVDSIIHNIQGLEFDEIPFCCSNVVTRVFYYKENDEWKKGTEFIHKLHSVIFKNAINQMENIPDEIQAIVSKKSDNYTYNNYRKQLISSRLYNSETYLDGILSKVLDKIGRLIKE